MRRKQRRPQFPRHSDGLPPAKRTPERLVEPGGNVDYERFRDEVIDHLHDDQLTYGVFDCSEMAVTSTLTLPKKKLTIIEGSYSCHPYFDEAVPM